MTENTENIVKIDTQSFIDMCQKIELQESQIKDLKLENEILRDENESYFETQESLILEVRELRKMVDGLKINNSKLTIERNRLVDKLNNVTLWDLSPEAQEAAGHALARDLLHPSIKADIAAEAHEAEVVSAMGS